MPNSAHRGAIFSPSSKRATNRSRSVHDVTLLPRHALLLRRGQEVSPMCPEYSVTYLAGRTPRGERTQQPLAPFVYPDFTQELVLSAPFRPGRCSASPRRTTFLSTAQSWRASRAADPG